MAKSEQEKYYKRLNTQTEARRKQKSRDDAAEKKREKARPDPYAKYEPGNK